MISVVLAPFILCFSLPKSAGRILDFFREFTVHVDGVGWVCSFAVFDFRKFNRIRGLNNGGGDGEGIVAGTNDTAGKMEQSIVDFKRNFPKWEPPNLDANAELKEILDRAMELQQNEAVTTAASTLSTTSTP
jgi:autophagy-related protein 9